MWLHVVSDEVRRKYLARGEFSRGILRTFDRDNLFRDVIDTYLEGDVVGEYPLDVNFKGEKAVDEGGVQRDLISAFWTEAYTRLFEGAKSLVPMVHSGMDLNVFPILGRIISHGYLACNYLPVNIALPSLISMVLGSTVSLPSSIIVESFMDYISDFERQTLAPALATTSSSPFSSALQIELVNILSRFGCRQMPTPQSLRTLVEQAARCEFCIKPAAALVLVHSGIPNTHKDFWQSRSASDVRALYYGFSVSTTKVLSMLDISPPGNDHESRVAGYLKLMVGNMQVHELSIFLRFVTGSSVCTVPTISVEFNALCGLGRRPIAHTCNALLELPISYTNYDDFHTEFKNILDVTRDTFCWRMDAF